MDKEPVWWYACAKNVRLRLTLQKRILICTVFSLGILNLLSNILQPCSITSQLYASYKHNQSDTNVIANNVLRLDNVDPHGVLNVRLPSHLSQFNPVINAADLRSLYDLTQTADTACRRAGLVCMLHHGALIGSFRHHALIPWDDDIDLFHNVSQWRQLQVVLNNISADYKAVVPNQKCGKGHEDFNHGCIRRMIFFKKIKSNTETFTYPYIDIIPYRDHNETHIFANHGAIFYEKSSIFPLSKRHLGPIEVSVPRNGLRVLDLAYGPQWMSMCVLRKTNHKPNQRQRKGKKVFNCDHLKAYYPFVRRKMVENGAIIETLVRNGTVLDIMN